MLIHYTPGAHVDWLFLVSGFRRGLNFWLAVLFGSGIFGGIALTVRFALCFGLRVRPGRALLRIVGHVPARSLELHGWRGDHLFDFATAFWTLLHHASRKQLDALKAMTAFLALIFVKGHARCVVCGRLARLFNSDLILAFDQVGKDRVERTLLSAKLKMLIGF